MLDAYFKQAVRFYKKVDSKEYWSCTHALLIIFNSNPQHVVRTVEVQFISSNYSDSNQRR